jgi:hypothetical protein
MPTLTQYPAPMHRDPAESARDRLRLLAAEFSLGMLPSWDVPPIADRTLSAGVYSDAVFELASTVYPTSGDVGPLIDKALGELGIAAPARTEAIWLAARAYVQAILEPAPGADLHAGLGRLMELSQLVGTELPGISAADIGLPNANYAGSNIDAAALYGLADAYHYVAQDFDAEQATHVAREASRRAEIDERVIREAKRWLQRHPE